MTYVASHAACLALLLLLFHTTGDMVARATRRLDPVGERTGLIRISIGIAVWMYLLMALAWAGLYRRGVLIGAAAAVGIAGLAWQRLDRRLTSKPNETRHDSAWVHVLAAASLALVFLPLFIRALGPELAWDDMSAQLTLPNLWLAHGGFHHMPFNVYSHWPSNVPVLYGLGLAIEDYVLGKLLHLMFLGLLTLAVYRVAARACAPWAGVVAAAFLVANDVVLVEATVANVDIAVAYFFFMAMTLALEFRETRSRAALVLSGLFCGVVAGSKITGLGSLACAAPLVVLGSFGSLTRGSERRLATAARDLAVFAATGVAVALPWLIKSYIETGDPLYPVLWKVFGGIEWSDALARDFWTWQTSAIGMGRTPYDYLVLPIRVILRGGGGFKGFGGWISKTWVVLLPLTVFLTPWVPLARRCLLPALVYFVIWATSSQQTRFLISILPLMAVATAAAAVWLVDRVPHRLGERFEPRIRGALRVAVVAGALVILAWESRDIRSGSLEVTRELIRAPPQIGAWTPDPAFAFVQHQLPASARVLMINNNLGFFLNREYVADSFFQASHLHANIDPIGDRAGLSRWFERFGITHVFVDSVRWQPFPPLFWDYLHDPATAVELYRSPDDGPFTIYELKPRLEQ